MYKDLADYTNYKILTSIPKDYELSDVYIGFKLIFPTEFLREGDVVLTKVKAYYTDYNIIGMQFTFGNRVKEHTTQLIGRMVAYNEEKENITTLEKEIIITEPVTKIEHLCVNTQKSWDAPKNSGWYVGNFKVND